MATIPRYQELGVQYADLPKVSTALQQARATGFDQLSRSLDRMTSYLQGERETQVKKEAAQYAVDNPLTKSQLEAALQDPSSLKIKGAGSVFQDTYQAYAAAKLSSDLQMQASTEFKAIELDFEANRIDGQSAVAKMQDLLDGQSALMRAVSPEYTVKHRAALATLAATSRNKIYETQQKVFFAEEKAKLDFAISNLEQEVEDDIRFNAGLIDVETQRPVNLGQKIQVRLEKFQPSIRTLGGDESYVKAAIEKAKSAAINVLVDAYSNSDLAATPSEAITKLRNNDAGKYSDLLKYYLSQDEKEGLEDRVYKAYEAKFKAADLERKTAAFENDKKIKVLGLKFANPKTTEAEKSTIADQMYSLDGITFQQLVDFKKPSDGVGDPVMFGQLGAMIKNNQITSPAQLIQYKSQLSKSEFSSLMLSVSSESHRAAERQIKEYAGTTVDIFSTETKQKIESKVRSRWLAKLGETKKNDKGIMVDLDPLKAAKEAIQEVKDEDAATNSLATQMNAINDAVFDSLKNQGVPLGAGFDLSTIDLSQYSGKIPANVLSDLLQQQKQYKKLLEQYEAR